MAAWAYYNEIDPYAAQWLRNLSAAGLIAPGEVDTRSIEDVHPIELHGFTQCHFFAGIGVWSYSLRRAGWPDDRRAWTGSCPCQPFSAAGKGAGLDDARHLWPAFSHLIGECRPPIIFGEQVASKDALGWWDVVRADLERARYACGAFDLCAAGVGAPHIRQRLYWLAHDHQHGREVERSTRVFDGLGPALGDDPDGRCPAGVLADGGQPGLEGRERARERADAQRATVERGCAAGELGDSESCSRPREHVGNGSTRQHVGALAGATSGSIGGVDSEGSGEMLAGDGRAPRFWDACDWIDCRDGKWRPVEPGTFPLAHGATARVGRLRAYGNAIVAPLAEEFIRAYLDLRP